MHERLRIEVEGAVQGVGFRPYVYRLARELGLAGFVANDTHGVTIELEGGRARLELFLERLPRERPAPASLDRVAPTWLRAAGHREFHIHASEQDGARTVQILPDISVCAECMAEVGDPSDRRHRYPFTNCTNCGPRWTIVRSLPYDRPRTTMAGFAMCAACREEYEDPLDRRFHAQPNACPACGPRVELWGPDGRVLERTDAAVLAAAAALAEGKTVALKGLGGFHLMVDARDGDAVARLRRSKPRRDKPFALMARDVAQARALCEVDDLAEKTLASVEAPIALLPRRDGAPVDASVAPRSPYLGVMLPYTPLHHLLLGALSFPVVATSGNLSDEPICIDEREAVERLRGVADLFLVHDRPIERHADDSVVVVTEGAVRVLRRARGYAPRPLVVPEELPTVLAVGGHLKNAVALAVGRQVFLSQHIGDMETPEAVEAFESVSRDLMRLYEAAPVAIAHDMHPDYVTTRWAEAEAGKGAALVAVQHHHAHLAACLAENGVDEPSLGVCWDGTGHGPDGTVWGGEFLLGTAASFRRVGHLRRFRLPGGEAAVREPRRSALALLWEIHGEDAFDMRDVAPVASFETAAFRPLSRMLARGVNAPWTTSAGRLFDGAAALAGLRQTTSFEGEAAMALEDAADPAVREAYPIELRAGASGAERDALVIDWGPLVEALVRDVRRSVPVGTIAARFHAALASAVVRAAREVGVARVALTGGCFQNRRLVEETSCGLREAGFDVLTHRSVPPNDGGLCLGQVAVAAARLASGRGTRA